MRSRLDGEAQRPAAEPWCVPCPPYGPLPPAALPNPSPSPFPVWLPCEFLANSAPVFPTCA